MTEAWLTQALKLIDRYAVAREGSAADAMIDHLRKAVLDTPQPPKPCCEFPVGGPCPDCPDALGVNPCEAPSNQDDARQGYARRNGGAKVYCCYGMYADAGHDADCENAPGNAGVDSGGEAQRLLPVKPTPEMEAAGNAAIIEGGCLANAMLSAAPVAGVPEVVAPTITDDELTRRFTRSIGGPNPMYRCNGCGYEEYGVRNLLLEHARICGVPAVEAPSKEGA